MSRYIFIIYEYKFITKDADYHYLIIWIFNSFTFIFLLLSRLIDLPSIYWKRLSLLNHWTLVWSWTYQCLLKNQGCRWVSISVYSFCFKFLFSVGFLFFENKICLCFLLGFLCSLFWNRTKLIYQLLLNIRFRGV